MKSGDVIGPFTVLGTFPSEDGNGTWAQVKCTCGAVERLRAHTLGRRHRCVHAVIACRNPECGVPVPDKHRGPPPIYCSKECGYRVAALEREAVSAAKRACRPRKIRKQAAPRYGVESILYGNHECEVRYLVVTREANTEHDDFNEAACEYRIRTERGAA